MKTLHTNTNIFFPKPIVVQVKYASMGTMYPAEHLALVRKTYKMIAGTWGHSDVQTTYGLEFFSSDTAYFCFSSAEDTLQFCITVPQSKQVKMWPSVKFTIHEVIEDLR